MTPQHQPGELGISSTTSVRKRLHVALQDTGAQVIIEAPRSRPAGLPEATGLPQARELPQATELPEATGSLRAFPARSSVTTEARSTGPGTRSAAA